MKKVLKIFIITVILAMTTMSVFALNCEDINNQFACDNNVANKCSWDSVNNKCTDSGGEIGNNGKSNNILDIIKNVFANNKEKDEEKEKEKDEGKKTESESSENWWNGAQLFFLRGSR